MDGDETVANNNFKLEQNNTSASTDTVSTASNSVYPESNKQQNKVPGRSNRKRMTMVCYIVHVCEVFFPAK